MGADRLNGLWLTTIGRHRDTGSHSDRSADPPMRNLPPEIGDETLKILLATRPAAKGRTCWGDSLAPWLWREGRKGQCRPHCDERSYAPPNRLSLTIENI
jgi:hypothetical protein